MDFFFKFKFPLNGSLSPLSPQRFGKVSNVHITTFALLPQKLFGFIASMSSTRPSPKCTGRFITYILFDIFTDANCLMISPGHIRERLTIIYLSPFLAMCNDDNFHVCVSFLKVGKTTLDTEQCRFCVEGIIFLLFSLANGCQWCSSRRTSTTCDKRYVNEHSIDSLISS